MKGANGIAEDFDFSRLIQGTPHMRVPFVIYFAALAYKISTDMAAEGIPPPKYLAFSGNGSRMLKFLSLSTQTLEDFFDAAFDIARGADADGDRLKVFANDDPKPLTARGGLYYMSTNETLDRDWSKQKESSRTVAEASDPEVLKAEMAYYAGLSTSCGPSSRSTTSPTTSASRVRTSSVAIGYIVGRKDGARAHGRGRDRADGQSVFGRAHLAADVLLPPRADAAGDRQGAFAKTRFMTGVEYLIIAAIVIGLLGVSLAVYALVKLSRK